MTPDAKGDTAAAIPPGNEGSKMTTRRELERPRWSQNGTLMRQPPVRHYIPKHHFYYTSQELFSKQFVCISAL